MYRRRGIGSEEGWLFHAEPVNQVVRNIRHSVIEDHTHFKRMLVVLFMHTRVRTNKNMMCGFYCQGVLPITPKFHHLSCSRVLGHKLAKSHLEEGEVAKHGPGQES